MGNHVVGKIFAAGASAFTNEQIDNFTREEAISILDRINNFAEEASGKDAEFDDYCNPDKKLGKILIKAFACHRYDEWKGRSSIIEEMYDEWDVLVWDSFHERYNFW